MLFAEQPPSEPTFSQTSKHSNFFTKVAQGQLSQDENSKVLQNSLEKDPPENLDEKTQDSVKEINDHVISDDDEKGDETEKEKEKEKT